MTKLLIDTTFVFDQFAKRGIGRYGKEVIKRIIDKVLIEKDWELHFIGFLNLHQTLIQLNLSQYTIEALLTKIHFHSLGEPNLSGANNILNWFKYYKPIIESIKPDIYYAVHFERGLPSTPFLKRMLKTTPKTIVMVHDAIPIATNSYSSKGIFANLIRGFIYRLLFKGIIKADIVLTNSDFSKNDLVQFGKVDPNKIHTIYLGVDKSFFRGNEKILTEEENHVLDIYQVKDKNYFFYDSGVESNKGIYELLTIFKELTLNNNLADTLVITGGDFIKGVGRNIKSRSVNGAKVLKEMKKLGILEKVICTDKINDRDLELLLFNAKIYLNFAKYEGFSFGPVQAMASGVFAIASNSSCTPEITQGGALLLNLTNIADAIKNIKEALNDKKIHQNYINKGRVIAKQYDWDETVNKTWQLIKSLG